MNQIDCPDFRVSVPDGEWLDHSTPEAYAFHLGEEEQLVAVVHRARQPMDAASIRAAVAELFRSRMRATQTLSEGKCRFESPQVVDREGGCDLFATGQDLHNSILFQIGFFGRPQRTVVVSYYDYTGTRTLEQFRERAGLVMASVVVA